MLLSKVGTATRFKVKDFRIKLALASREARNEKANIRRRELRAPGVSLGPGRHADRVSVFSSASAESAAR